MGSFILGDILKYILSASISCSLWALKSAFQPQTMSKVVWFLLSCCKVIAKCCPFAASIHVSLRVPVVCVCTCAWACVRVSLSSLLQLTLHGTVSSRVQDPPKAVKKCPIPYARQLRTLHILVYTCGEWTVEGMADYH